MWISRLSLRNYRSYPELDLEFEPGVTTFVADNGTGKTNIVEAIGIWPICALIELPSMRHWSTNLLTRQPCQLSSTVISGMPR